MTAIMKNLQRHWVALRPLLAIRNEAQYDQAVEQLNALIDEIGTDEAHPLYELLDTLGTLVHAYEEQYHPVPDCSGREMVGFLMEEHGLKQADLPEIGSQGIVSEVLNGKRELNVRQIRVLAKRFHVSPAVFI